MRKSVTSLRNSLISLALAAAIPAAWATDPPQTPAAVLGTAVPAKATAPVKLTVPAQDSTRPPTPHTLDIKPPDIHQVMSAEQIAAAIPNPDETEVVDPETVAVRGEVPAPYVPSGFGALYWAAIHPADSWRILAPVQ